MKSFTKILKEFVAIKSISTDSKYKDEINKAVKGLADFCSKNKLKTKIIRDFDNPIIIAKTTTNPKLKTILVYGHYDVVPADPSMFNLQKKSGRFYGRGTADNKGQILVHLYSVIKLLRENKLGLNVIFELKPLSAV